MLVVYAYIYIYVLSYTSKFALLIYHLLRKIFRRHQCIGLDFEVVSLSITHEH